MPAAQRVAEVHVRCRSEPSTIGERAFRTLDFIADQETPRPDRTVAEQSPSTTETPPRPTPQPEVPEPDFVPPELRRDARLLRRARGVAAIALPLLLWTEPLDATPSAVLPGVPLGILLAGILLLVNLVDPTVDPRATRELIERWAVIELALDTAVMASVVWLVALDPASSLWVLLLLPVLEAALRFRVQGALLTTLTVALLYVSRDAFVANRFDEVTFDSSTVMQRIGVLGIVAFAAGTLAARLAREAWRHRQVRADAERRSAILAAVADAAAEMTTLDMRRVRDAIHRALDRIDLSGRVLSLDQEVPADHLSVPIMTNGRLRGRIVVADPVPVEAHGAIELLATQAGTVIGQVEAFLEAEELRKRLEHQAFHDPLTGLPNRAAFDNDLREQSDRRRPPGEGLAVLFIDLDGFKLVNDRLGHDAGDALLEAAARRLEACVRPDDMVARLGGDEFTVLLPGAQDVDGAIVVADRILERLDAPFAIAGTRVRVSASIGVAFSPVAVDEPDRLVRQADQAMYDAKRGGRSRVVVFGRDEQKPATSTAHVHPA